MLLKELLRLKTDRRSGALPMELLRRLCLPLPEDVLEQFIGDHGIKGEFQEQYGQLDLHALEWRLVPTAAREIIACSVYPDFQDYLDGCRERILAVPKTGWKEVNLAPDATEHWQTHGTWRRAPVFIRGELVGSNRPLHLIEGHTRTGALTGLVESGWLPGESLHDIWVASQAETLAPDTTWQQVLREERMPFIDWLIYGVPDDGPLGKVSFKVLSAKCDEELTGDDLAAVMNFIAGNPTLAQHADLVREAHVSWKQQTMR